MFAKKSLGQHFLTDKRVLAAIADAVGVVPLPVIEIGPGHGELTHALLARGHQVTAIEKDDALAHTLVTTSLNGLRVVHGDALHELPLLSKAYQERGSEYAVAGNIPYYITGHILRVIGELSYRPQRTVLLMQKEVAERIVASEGALNLLASSVLWWAQPHLDMRVARGAFNPPPKVDSAVVVFEGIPSRGTQELAQQYYIFIRALFKQPRKTIFNNLIHIIPDRAALMALLDRVGVAPSSRPHLLSPALLMRLFEEFSSW